VVITGIGVIGPIGQTAAETWENAVQGVSGVSPITRFDPEAYETRFAGQVAGFDPAQLIGRKESRRMDRYTQFAVAAALQAREQAGLANANVPPERIGTLIGTGMGGMETIDQGAESLFTNGPGRLSPFFVPMMLPNMASGSVAITTGAKGPNFATISACASSAHAIGEGTGLIRRDDVDLVFAGGGEAPVTRLGVAGFNAMSALSRRNDDPSRASRPFDADRDGFVLAEGGAVLVLEERQHALDRGAEILGEVVGYATTDDANHIVQPGPGGEGAARAMRLALNDAGLEPPHVDYIKAHGTSTLLNERLESHAF
jgi:3-oxoacyl-[acyl-carrier-protein] synthase II